MNNSKCSKNCLMLGIPEASRFDMAEMSQMETAMAKTQLLLNVQFLSSPGESLVENAKKGKKINVNDIFTCSTAIIKMRLSKAATIFHHRLNLQYQKREGEKTA